MRLTNWGEMKIPHSLLLQAMQCQVERMLYAVL